MAADFADRELVQARQRHLSAVRVTGQHQGDPKAPKTVRLLGDVRKRDGREIVAQAFDGLVAAGVSRIGVVQADHLQAFVTEGDGRVPVAQHLDAPALERVPHLFRTRPVIVIAEHGHHRRLERAYDLRQLIQVKLTVTDEVAAQQDEVRLLGVGHLDGGELHLDGRDTPDVLIGQVRDPQVADLIAVSRRAGEAAQLDPEAARRVRRAPARVRTSGRHARRPRGCRVQ